MTIEKLLQNPFSDMQAEKKEKLFKVLKIVNYVVAGVFALFALIALVGNFARLFNHLTFFSFISGLLTAGAYVMLALSIFMRKKLFTLIGFGAWSLTSFINMIYGFVTISSLKYSGLGTFFGDLLFAGQGVIMFFAYLVATALVLIALNFIKPFEKFQSTAKKLWFAPALCFVIYYIFDFFAKILDIFGGDFRFGVVFTISSTFVLMVAALYALFVSVDPYDVCAEEAEVNGNTFDTLKKAATSTEEADSIYMSLVAHILLLVFTFGVWGYMWIFKTTRRLNDRGINGEQSPVAQLLLCMFVPFYIIFWVNRTAHRIDTLGREKNSGFFSIGMLCLFLSIFTSFIAPAIIMQIKMNAIAKVSGEAPEENAEQKTEEVTAQV